MPRLVKSKRLRILDFDIENRPLSYLGMDFTTSEITAIAASFEGESKVHAFLLGDVVVLEGGATVVRYLPDMLDRFVYLYDEADIVTGHYITRHDLPIINGALMELGLPGLGPKLVSDTKTDLKIAKGVSKSQESLSDMYGLSAPKYHMTNPMWREANRLTPEGIEQTRTRVTSDIRQHKQLRKRLIERNMLRPPTIWKP